VADEKTETVNKDSEYRRVEFSFPLLWLRTKVFSGLFDRLGAFRFSRWLSWIALMMVPVVGGIGLYFLIASVINLLWNPAVVDVVRQAGPTASLLLPGINPYVPFFYGWFAIFCAMIIHEGAHGIAARSLGLKVKSSGLLCFLVFPFAAFVDVDEEELKRSSGKVASRVLASGVGGNVALGAVCLIGVLLIVGGLAPVVDGVYLVNVIEGMPAEAAGLLPEDVLISVDDMLISNMDDLRFLLDSKTSGDLVEVTVARGDMWQNEYSTVVNLTIYENQTVMGIGAIDLMMEQKLRIYQNVTPQNLLMYMFLPAMAPDFVPFSEMLAPFYESGLGPQWAVYANILFWIWWVNINIAIFNALPIYPMDGGRIFNIALKKVIRRKNSEKIVTAITAVVSVALVLAFILMIVVPFII